METIFLVPDSREHKRRLRKRNKGAESQAERKFGCHVTGLLNVQFGCLPSCTMYPTSLCALKEEQESIPWRKKKSQWTQRIRLWETLAKGHGRLQLCGWNVQTGRKSTKVVPDSSSVLQLRTNVLSATLLPKLTLAACLWIMLDIFF